MATAKQIATYIFTKGLQETHYWVGTVKIEDVELEFDMIISWAEYDEISNTIWELFGSHLADINNNGDDEGYFDEGVWSLNYFGELCFNEVDEPILEDADLSE